MNIIEQGTIIHYHQHRQESFGDDDVQTLGWKNLQSQQKRFDIIAELVDFNNTSVLDAGCGKGDFLRFLLQRSNAVRYIGIDLNPDFVAYANEQFCSCQQSRFYQADFSVAALPLVDHVVLSGALSYRTKDPVYWKKIISRLFSNSRRSLVFNFLSDKTFPEHPLLVSYSVDEVIDFCQSICRQLDIRSGYIDHDTTLCLHW
ncbi:MAG: class I SAM-dependent methyltransferase [Reinekea sp.]|jgi:SAM-dependent methyltransferase